LFGRRGLELGDRAAASPLDDEGVLFLPATGEYEYGVHGDWQLLNDSSSGEAYGPPMSGVHYPAKSTLNLGAHRFSCTCGLPAAFIWLFVFVMLLSE
jgi:hypothetical protein